MGDNLGSLTLDVLHLDLDALAKVTSMPSARAGLENLNRAISGVSA
jgi:hypothetical protein